MITLIADRLLAAVDLVFDALNALCRVALRGVFAPDAQSHRGERYSLLSSKDILIQEIALNAADPDQAKKAILLDSERYLPLDLETVAFDVAGPLEGPAEDRSRPELTYVLGVVRKDQLSTLRAELPGARGRVVEAFVHTPAAAPTAALVFEDASGRARRHLRRTLCAGSLIAFAIGALVAGQTATTALDRLAASAAAERLVVERRIRQADHSLATTQALGRAATPPLGPRLAALAQQLYQIGLHEERRAELTRVVYQPSGLQLFGRAYEPDAAELAFRRAFEGQTLTFSTEAGPPPQAFTVQMGATPGTTP